MAKQNKGRKLFATTATAALVASAIVPVASAAEFNDAAKIPSWAKDAVNYLTDKGFIQGDEKGNFNPTGTLTRAEAAEVLSKALELKAEGTEDFSDVAENNWFYKAVLATSPELFQGDGTGKFNPNAKLTREQAAKVIVEGFGLTGTADLSKFTDASKVANWSKGYLSTAVANGVINGKGSLLAPQDQISRAEFATMVKRSIDAVEKADPAVKSVSAISATQVEIKFNKAVDPASVFANGVSGAFAGTATVTFTSLDTVASGALTGTLSKDGKTLTVTSANPLSKRYDVVVEGLKTKDSKEVTKYAEMITIAADKTAPTIVSSVKTSASTYKVTFSEPLNSLGTVTYKFADGTTATVSNDFAPGAKEVTFTLDPSIAAGKVVTATLVGTQDEALNLLTPNPATVTFAKGEKDGVAPTVSAITQTGAKSYSVKFSEELSTVVGTGLFTIAGNATVSVKKDSEDPTKYNVVTTNALDGLTTVSIGTVTDLSGEEGAATSRVVNFVKDGVAPKVTSSAVVTDSTDKKEYLEITFDKDVELSTPTVDATAGTSSKDYVTTTLVDTDITAQTVAYKNANNKKVVRVALATLLGAQDVEGATFKLDLVFSGVTSGAGVGADTAKTTFTRGKDGVPQNATVLGDPTVTADLTDNNKVIVTFPGAVDGASATNVANYKVDGAVIESVTLKPLSGGTQVAVLNLKAGSNTFTGVRNISVENVKALGSTKTMLPYSTNAVSLNENVAPVVTSAKLTATDKVTLTFSEAVSDSTANDFEVLIGGASQSPAENISVAVTSANTIVVTIATIDATELSKGVSLKALSTLDIVDGAGNKVSVPNNIAITQ